MELCPLEDWIRAQAEPGPPDGPLLTIADLFSGCGGLTLGAIEGLRHKQIRGAPMLAVDSAPHALGVYEANLVVDGIETRLHGDDICKLFDGVLEDDATAAEAALSSQIGALDLLVAGPPCQGHSDLNNHSRRDDPRNSLYLRVIRAAEVLAPQAIVIENVPTVVHDRKRVVQTAKAELQRLRYDCDEIMLRADDLGLPQRRRRHFLVASRLGRPDSRAMIQPHMDDPAAIWPYLRDLEGEAKASSSLFRTPSGISETNRARIAYLFEHGEYDLPDSERPDCHRKKPHSYKSVYGRLHQNEPAQTITSGFGSMGQGRYVHPTEPRTLTPHEAARLQGFPDFFDFSSATKRTALHEMIGNAVPPKMAAVLIWGLFDQGLLQPRGDHAGS